MFVVRQVNDTTFCSESDRSAPSTYLTITTITADIDVVIEAGVKIFYFENNAVYGNRGTVCNAVAGRYYYIIPCAMSRYCIVDNYLSGRVCLCTDNSAFRDEAVLYRLDAE